MADAAGLTQDAPTPAPDVPFELARRFAQAVAALGQKALLIDRANQGIGLVGLASGLNALETGQAAALAVYLRPEILAGDYDQPEQAGDAVTLAGELRAEGLQPVLVASGQPGHRHLFVRVDDVEQRALVRSRLKASGADVRAGNQPIRPPLSPHRLGLQPKLLLPSDPEQALAALEDPDAERRSATRRPKREMSAATRKKLAESPPPGERSEPIMAALVGLANAGFDEAGVWAEMTAKPLGQRYNSGDRNRAHFAKEWRKATRFVAANPPFADGTDVRKHVQRLLDDARAQAWPGMAGTSTLAILQAHATVACRRGATSYGASQRELAELAGVTLPTVRKANATRIRKGLLKAQARGGIRKGRRVASTWTLRVDAAARNVATLYHSPHTPRVGLNGKDSLRSGLTVEALLRHDVSRWRALGKGFPALFLALENLGAARVSTLAALLNRHRVTVSNQLRRLVVEGVAERSAGKRGLYRLAVAPEAIIAKLDRVAVRLGTAGDGLRQQEAFEAQRAALDVPLPDQKPAGTVYRLKPGGKFAGNSEGNRIDEDRPHRRMAARVVSRNRSRLEPGRSAARR